MILSGDKSQGLDWVAAGCIVVFKGNGLMCLKLVTSWWCCPERLFRRWDLAHALPGMGLWEL